MFSLHAGKIATAMDGDGEKPEAKGVGGMLHNISNFAGFRVRREGNVGTIR
jgi:hypothetical protein